MQTLLPLHDQFSIKASPQRNPIPTFLRTKQPLSQPFSQIIKDHRQAKTSDILQKAPKTLTSSEYDSRETKSNSIRRQRNDALNRSEHRGETEKFADKIKNQSSARVDDARNFKSYETNAQDNADTAQSRTAQSAESDNSNAPDTTAKANNKSNIEDSPREPNGSTSVHASETSETAILSGEVVVSPNQIDQTQQEPVADPEVPVNSETQTSLPVEPSSSADGEHSSVIDTDRIANSSAKESGQSHALSQTVATEDSAKANQAQDQLSHQPENGNTSASKQDSVHGSIEKQELISAQRQASQDAVLPTNLRTEDQPVQTEARPTSPSNSQTTQTNAQINQTIQVTVGQDQQQSPTEDKPSDKGYSEPRTDGTKVKSSSDPQAKSNLPQTQETTSSRSAASARAVQIDAAIKVENATGQPVTVQVQAKPVVQVVPGSASVSNGAEGQALNLPSSSADSLQDPAQARILRGLTATLNQRGGALTMRLDPPDLGQLRIQMSIVKGSVTANFQVQTPQAQALLERSLATLKSALQGQGLTVERLTVQTTPQQTNTQNARQESDQQASQQRQQHDASQGESRGRRDEQSQNTMNYRSQLKAMEYAAFDLNPQPVGAD